MFAWAPTWSLGVCLTFSIRPRCRSFSSPAPTVAHSAALGTSELLQHMRQCVIFLYSRIPVIAKERCQLGILQSALRKQTHAWMQTCKAHHTTPAPLAPSQTPLHYPTQMRNVTYPCYRLALFLFVEGLRNEDERVPFREIRNSDASSHPPSCQLFTACMGAWTKLLLDFVNGVRKRELLN